MDVTRSHRVVRQSLPSVKSSVAYDWYKDLRRLDGTPLSGVRTTAHAVLGLWLQAMHNNAQQSTHAHTLLCCFSQEIAGIGGDVRMFRGEVSAERNWTWQRTLQADGSVAGSNHWRDVWMSPGIVRSARAAATCCQCPH